MKTISLKSLYYSLLLLSLLLLLLLLLLSLLFNTKFVFDLRIRICIFNRTRSLMQFQQIGVSGNPIV